MIKILSLANITMSDTNKYLNSNTTGNHMSQSKVDPNLIKLLLTDPELDVSIPSNLVSINQDNEHYEINSFQSNGNFREMSSFQNNIHNSDQDVAPYSSHIDVSMSGTLPKEESTQLYSNQESMNQAPKRREVAKPKLDTYKPRLSVLTWNIWFDNKNQKERTLRIIQIIKQLDVDIVCLQEVTVSSHALIKSRLLGYQLFQIFIEEGYEYGTCILCKKDTVRVIDPYYYDFPETQMGRKILGCEIELLKFGSNMHILTTHLESMWDNKDVRNQQFNVIKEVIADLDNLILAGDFNICSHKETIEKNIQSTNLIDSWIQIGCPESIKWTYDGTKNANINGNTKSRLDRIYYRQQTRILKELRLVGLNATGPNIPEPPSDHYALYAVFE